MVPTELPPVALLMIARVAAPDRTEVLVMDSAPAARRATVMGGYYMLFQQLGGVAAPLIGVLAGLVGIGPTFHGLTLGLAIGSAMVLLFHRRLL